MITACAIGATVLQLLDQTIANVALPYMQGSFSSSFDEITWVLTSYITASAIMTAPVGWLAARYGRKPLYVGCILGFTIASMLCGAAQSLGQIVVFRVVQGMFGAALVPLSQATLLDIYPPERRGFAMAIWGVGVMLGPIMGPTLGGWLTETYSWRWVFYINLPFGLENDKCNANIGLGERGAGRVCGGCTAWCDALPANSVGRSSLGSPGPPACPPSRLGVLAFRSLRFRRSVVRESALLGRPVG